MTTSSDMLDRLSRTIDRAASADIAGLVDEARLEARSKVRAILAEAIAERLLELAEAELGRGASAPTDQGERPATRSPCAKDRDVSRASSEPPARPGDGSRAPDLARPGRLEPEATADRALAYYVYGVVDADAQIEHGLTGVDEVHAVSLVRSQAVAAVVSPVPLDEFGEQVLREHLDDLAWLERRAHRHEHVLDRVRRQTTLVPMRLCTIYHDEGSVREMLEREHEFLEDALRRLTGRTEWGVKLYAVAELSEAAAREPAQRGEPAGDPGSGIDYLMEKQQRHRHQERIEAAVEQHSEHAHLALARVAVEAKLNPVQPRELTHRDEPMVFNGVYLVDDAALEGFTAVVARLGAELAEHGLEPELTGPWPPYNFVGSPTEVGR